MNPHHAPETAAAIWQTAMNARITRHSKNMLFALLEGWEDREALREPPTLIRALEICLARVKMDQRMARDLRAALNTERGNAARKAAYSGAGDLSAGVPNRFDPNRRGFNP